MKNRSEEDHDELRPEYHFDYSKADRGKYYRRILAEGSNVVVLDPDIAESFHDSASVNEALRSILALTKKTKQMAGRVDVRKEVDA